jgi:PTS system glucose-specific IIC component
MSAFSSAFSYLQKIGKCMMLPVSVLPVAGILLGVGSANFSWLPQIVSQIMAQSGGAIFSNLPLLFAIGVAIGLTNNDGVAALASTVGFAVFLATMGVLAKMRGSFREFDPRGAQRRSGLAGRTGSLRFDRPDSCPC